MVKSHLWISGISFLIALMLGWLFLWPKYQALSFKREKVAEKEIELRSVTSYLADLEETSQKLKEHQSQLQKIEYALPETFFLPEVLNFLQQTASQSGLLLKGITPLIASPKEGEMRETKISFGLIGDYPAFKNFLLALEKSARLIEVEKIDLSPAGQGLNFDLVIKVYSY